MNKSLVFSKFDHADDAVDKGTQVETSIEVHVVFDFILKVRILPRFDGYANILGPLVIPPVVLLSITLPPSIMPSINLLTGKMQFGTISLHMQSKTDITLYTNLPQVA